MNVVQYCAIITLLDNKGVLKENRYFPKEKRIPAWRKVMEERINNIRRKISLNMVIINCHKESKPLTAHQMTIRTKLKRWYGNTRQDTLL